MATSDHPNLIYGDDERFVIVAARIRNAKPVLSCSNCASSGRCPCSYCHGKDKCTQCFALLYDGPETVKYFVFRAQDVPLGSRAKTIAYPSLTRAQQGVRALAEMTDQQIAAMFGGTK